MQLLKKSWSNCRRKRGQFSLSWTGNKEMKHVTYFGENRSKMCNICWAFFKLTIFSFIPLIYMLQSYNELCCEIHLRECRNWITHRVSWLALSLVVLGTLYPRAPNFAEMIKNRWDEMRWKKLSFCTNLRATDRFICPNWFGVCSHVRVIIFCVSSKIHR